MNSGPTKTRRSDVKKTEDGKEATFPKRPLVFNITETMGQCSSYQLR
jgi:hypothetical protein